jgi:hypothetical protein
MQTYRTYVKTNDGIVIFLSDGIKHVLEGNPLFDKVQAKIEAGDFDTIPDVVDRASRIKKNSNGRFWINDEGVIVIDGIDIDEHLSERILKFDELGLPTLPLTNFWDLLMKNPDEDARKDLFGFLKHNDIPMAADGRFMCYKRVWRASYAAETKSIDLDTANVFVNIDGVMTEVVISPTDLVDCRTATIRNNPGDKPFMDRADVDHDRNQSCSAGLHVAAYGYADKGYYQNGEMIEVLVCPSEVCSVPVDYNGEKMRATGYEVVRIAAGPRSEPLAFTVNADVKYTHPDSGMVENVTIVEAKDGTPNRYNVRCDSDGVVLDGVSENDLSWPSNFAADDDDEDDNMDEDNPLVADDPRTVALLGIIDTAVKLGEDARNALLAANANKDEDDEDIGSMDIPIVLDSGIHYADDGTAEHDEEDDEDEDEDYDDDDDEY